MKYLALLRDSFREALDTKVIYFTFGLSLFLIMILLSLSYRPLTVREEVESFCNQINTALGFAGGGKLGGKPMRFEVTKFEQLNETDKPWDGDYHFTITVEMAKKLLENQDSKQILGSLQMAFRQNFWWLNNLKVSDGTVETRDDDARLEWAFTSKGTKVDHLRDWPHEATLFFGLLPMSWFHSSLTGSVYWIENILINNIGGWVIILIAVIVTAFFIPNMLQKGSIDLLLVKPITRVTLLMFKYLGGLAFVLINALVAIMGVWLVIGLRTGIWTWSFPLSALIITFFFAILYSVSTLFGVLTRSSVLAIFMTCLVWFCLFLLGQFHSWLNSDTGMVRPATEQQIANTTAKKPANPETKPPKTFGSSDPVLEQVTNVINVVHAILPRTNDLGHLTTQLISTELLSEAERKAHNFRDKEFYAWGESLGVSLAFIAVMLTLACWRFAVRDY